MLCFSAYPPPLSLSLSLSLSLHIYLSPYLENGERKGEGERGKKEGESVLIEIILISLHINSSLLQ